MSLTETHTHSIYELILDFVFVAKALSQIRHTCTHTRIIDKITGRERPVDNLRFPSTESCTHSPNTDKDRLEMQSPIKSTSEPLFRLAKSKLISF